jgi:hypothetical protein
MRCSHRYIDNLQGNSALAGDATFDSIRFGSLGTMARKGSSCANGTNAVGAYPLWQGGIIPYRRTSWNRG